MSDEKNFEEEMLDEEEMDVIVLTLDDDSEIECAILEIFPLDGKDYIALVTLDEEQKVLLYEFSEDEKSEEIEVSMIEDEEEFERVAEEFNRLMNEEAEEEEEDREHHDGCCCGHDDCE